MNTDKTKNYDMGKWNRWNVLQIFSSNLYFALAFSQQCLSYTIILNTTNFKGLSPIGFSFKVCAFCILSKKMFLPKGWDILKYVCY